MAFPSWLVGVLASVLATSVGAAGKVGLKISHSHQVRPGALLSPRAIAFLSGVAVLVLNPLFSLLAYRMAAQSIVAPLAGLTVVWNVMLAPVMTDEKLSRHDVAGAALVLLGCTVESIVGDHADTDYDVEDVREYFRAPGFLLLALVMALAIAAGMAIIKVRALQQSVSVGSMRFVIGATSGCVGGQYYFIKSLVALMDDEEFLELPETYLLTAATVASAVGGVTLLSHGLRTFDALEVIPLYQSSLILTGSLSGLIFWQELELFSPMQEVVYPMALLCIVFGLIVISMRPVNERAAHMSAAELLEDEPSSSASVEQGSVDQGSVELSSV